MLPVSRTALALALCGAITSTSARADDPVYSVTNLPSFGGTRNQGNSINDLELVAGFTTKPGSLDRHASTWFSGHVADLGTLGGPNSNVVWPVKNLFGRIVGISQTNSPELLGEKWSCAGFFNASPINYICRGFVWEAGHLRALPTLGGENGFAAGANNRGQITGWAETTVHDPSCEGPGEGKSGQVLQFLPVIYGAAIWSIRPLPLLPGDSSGAATAINDRGQAIGISGACDQAAGRYTAAHAVLWENGTVIDIGKGKLTAPFWNTPMAINERGDVVGFAGDPTDATGNITHAFLWTHEGGMQLLDSAATDNSTATGINEKRQVVGYFVAADGSLHGFVWDHDHGLRDLNQLKRPDYTGVIALADDINDVGMITGRTANDASGARSAIVMTPLTGIHGANESSRSEAPFHGLPTYAD